MKNRLITIECDQSTMDKMEYYARADGSKVYMEKKPFFWQIHGFTHIINGETLYFLKEQWNEYKRDWKGTP